MRRSTIGTLLCRKEAKVLHILEVHRKVVEITRLLAEELPDEEDEFYCDWEALAGQLGDIARQCMLTGCRIASYAGIVAKKAKKGEWCGETGEGEPGELFCFDENGELVCYDQNDDAI